MFISIKDSLKMKLKPSFQGGRKWMGGRGGHLAAEGSRRSRGWVAWQPWRKRYGGWAAATSSGTDKEVVRWPARWVPSEVDGGWMSTSEVHGRAGAGRVRSRAWLGQRRSGKVGVRRSWGSTGRARPGSGVPGAASAGAKGGSTRHRGAVGGSSAQRRVHGVEEMRERDAGEKRAGSGTISAYIRRADQPTNIRRNGLRGGGCDTLYLSATRTTRRT
jgi:hypothetical protein